MPVGLWDAHNRMTTAITAADDALGGSPLQLATTPMLRAAARSAERARPRMVEADDGSTRIEAFEVQPVHLFHAFEVTALVAGVVQALTEHYRSGPGPKVESRADYDVEA